jgi:hypothetical protein
VSTAWSTRYSTPARLGATTAGGDAGASAGISQTSVVSLDVDSMTT